MNMLTLLYFVSIKQPKNKGYPQNSIKSVATANTTHQEYTSVGVPTYPYFSKPIKIRVFQLYQSPSSPVYTRKTLQVFRIYETVGLEHENTFQNYLVKKVTLTIQNEP